jgi:heme oxygenase
MENHTIDLATMLREHTWADHHALDRHPILAVLVRKSVTISEYASALAALHGAHRAIENLLEGFAPGNLFPGRTPDIEADLHDLGCRPHPLGIPVPPSSSPADKLGMMYVIEGSNRGGSMIAKHLSQVFPQSVPRRFFGKADEMVRWQHFWQFVRQRSSAHDYPMVVKAAHETFGFYWKHIDSCR